MATQQQSGILQGHPGLLPCQGGGLRHLGAPLLLRLHGQASGERGVGCQWAVPEECHPEAAAGVPRWGGEPPC